MSFHRKLKNKNNLFDVDTGSWTGGLGLFSASSVRGIIIQYIRLFFGVIEAEYFRANFKTALAAYTFICFGSTRNGLLASL
jgi:hypothetical protein